MKSKQQLKPRLLLVLSIPSMMWSSLVLAETCTYQESVMAFEQNNSKRGMTLMKMAAHDGDLRAQKFLQQLENNDLSKKLFAGRQTDSKSIIR